MPIDVHHVAALINEFGQDVRVRRTVNNSMKAAAITGVATLLGGLLDGRRGVLLGATGGGLLGMSMTDHDFVGLPTAFNRLPPHARQRVVNHFQNIVDGLDPSDAGIIIQVAGALANGANLSQLGDIGPVRTVFQNSIDFIRERVQEAQATNPNLLN